MYGERTEPKTHGIKFRTIHFSDLSSITLNHLPSSPDLEPLSKETVSIRMSDSETEVDMSGPCLIICHYVKSLGNAS